MRLVFALLSFLLAAAPAGAVDDAGKRLGQNVCLASDTAAALAAIEAATRDDQLPPLAIAEALGTADALAGRGYCRARRIPRQAFEAFRTAHPHDGALDEAFSHARLVAGPPRGSALPRNGGFDGSFLALKGPGRQIISQ